MTLSEDNPDCSAHIDQALITLVMTTRTEPMALRVLCAGILSNLSVCTLECIQTTIECVSQDWTAFMEKAHQVSLAIETAAPTDSVFTIEEMKQMVPQNAPAVDALESQLRYVQIALEILSNLFCEDLDPEQAQEEWEDEDMDEDEEMMRDMDPVLDQEVKVLPGLEFLTQSSLLQSLLEMMVLSGPSDAKLTIVNEEWGHVRIRVLGVLNNIFGLLDSTWASSHTLFIQSLWTGLFQIGSNADKDMLSSVMETVWALSRILAPNAVQPTLEQARGLIHLFQIHSDLQTACVGILGYMGRCQGCIPLNQACLGQLTRLGNRTLFDDSIEFTHCFCRNSG